MNTISTELRGVLTRHIEAANARQILTIASALCDLDAASANTSIVDAPVTRFVYVPGTDGADTVVDNENGLIWTHQNVPGGRMTWREAHEAVAKLRIGGHSDWRLPTIRELLTLVDYSRTEPAIDTVYFPTCESDWYWTGTPLASSPGVCAWVVDFNGGSADWYDQSYSGLVRAVRASQ